MGASQGLVGEVGGSVCVGGGGGGGGGEALSVLPCSLKIMPKSPQLSESITLSLKLFCYCSQILKSNTASSRLPKISKYAP